MVKVIYNGVTYLPSDYWQLLSLFFLSTMAINAVMLFEPSKIDVKVIDFWMISSMIYIVIVFIVLFVTPMISVLSYISTSRDTDTIDVDSVYSLWIYLLWSAIVYKIMLIPLYYICNVTLDKSKSIESIR